MIDLNKPSQLFKILISLITILPFHLILLGSLFSGNIRNNLFNIFKTLLDKGIIGAYIILVLLYLFIPNMKLWYLCIKSRAFNTEIYMQASAKTIFEEHMSKFLYLYAPLLILCYFLIF